MIQLRGVTKKYKKQYALKNINLDIMAGEFVFLTGPSGAGKSTLMKLLYREEQPTCGVVMIGNGMNIANLPDDKVPNLRRCMGIVFQDYKLLPNMSVYDNVAYVIRTLGLSTKEINARVIGALKVVGLADKIHAKPTELSGGEQQRVSIARAIAKNPKLLLCDEPTGALDSKTGVEVLKLLRKQCDANNGANTVIIVTHNSLIADIADTIVHVKNGKIESVITNQNPKKIEEVKW